MKRHLEGFVEAITAERSGAQELVVRIPASEPDAAGDTRRHALNLTALVGSVAVGDRVLLNVVAVEMKLGSGGLDFVVVNLSRPAREDTPPGHIIKLRYTPHQFPVLAVEAPESPYHDTIAQFETLEETPVVCAELHSQVPAICAAARWALNDCEFPRAPRIAYIMTDGAALAMAFSRLVPQMKAQGLLEATITSGQAFGGDYEAVNLYSALAAAKAVVGADIIVVGQGPGNVGTATPLGFSGIEQGLAINAVDSLGGIPIAVTRVSFADPRERHRALSHHTVTALSRIARAPALVALPRLPEIQRLELMAALEETGIADLHQPITVDADRGLVALEASGLVVTTMGRSIAEERAFFLSAAAAGLLAAQLVEARAFRDP